LDEGTGWGEEEECNQKEGEEAFHIAHQVIIFGGGFPLCILDTEALSSPSIGQSQR